MTQRSIYDLLEQLYRARTRTQTKAVALEPFASDQWQMVVGSDPSRVALTIQNVSPTQDITYRVGESLTGGNDSNGFVLGSGQSYTVNALFDFAQPADDIVAYGSTTGAVLVVQEALITPPLEQ